LNCEGTPIPSPGATPVPSAGATGQGQAKEHGARGEECARCFGSKISLLNLNYVDKKYVAAYNFLLHKRRIAA